MSRQRPSGTSVYNTPTRVTARAVICTDGIAQPPQLVRISTPKGRGRFGINPTVTPVTTSSETTTKTTRWRKRRSTSNASTSPNHNTASVTHEPAKASPCQSAVRPGARNPASHPTTASSTTVTVTAGPRTPLAKTTIVKPTSTTVAISQPVPLVRR